MIYVSMRLLCTLFMYFIQFIISFPSYVCFCSDMYILRQLLPPGNSVLIKFNKQVNMGPILCNIK